MTWIIQVEEFFNESDVGSYWPGAARVETSTSVLQSSFLELLCMWFAGRQVNLQTCLPGHYL